MKGYEFLFVLFCVVLGFIVCCFCFCILGGLFFVWFGFWCFACGLLFKCLFIYFALLFVLISLAQDFVYKCLQLFFALSFPYFSHPSNLSVKLEIKCQFECIASWDTAVQTVCPTNVVALLKNKYTKIYLKYIFHAKYTTNTFNILLYIFNIIYLIYTSIFQVHSK